MPAASKPKTTNVPDQRALALELLELRRTHAAIYGQEARLKASLIAIATAKGEGFREFIDNLGTVNVSPAKEKKFNGELPEVNTERFLALSDAKRQRLLEAGILVMTESWSRADYGRVYPKLF